MGKIVKCNDFDPKEFKVPSIKVKFTNFQKEKLLELLASFKLD